MKAIETIGHLRRAHPRRLKSMLFAHVWKPIAPYGITSAETERKP